MLNIINNFMVYVLLALLLFSASVAAHIVYCRRAVGKALQAKAFIVIVFLFLGVYASGAWWIKQTGVWPLQSFWGLPFQITAGAIFLMLAPLYLCFYVLTQLESPSKKILWITACHGRLSYTDIVHGIEEEDFINKRMDDLETSGCIKEDNGRYVLTASGRRINGVLEVMQGILGRGMGG